MKKHYRDPKNVYILVRIDDIRGRQGVRYFLDPWRLMQTGKLSCGPPDDEGNVLVHTNV